MSLRRLVLLVLAVQLAAATPAWANEVLYLDNNTAFPDRQRVRAVFRATPSSSRTGAYGFLHVRLHNPDVKKAHQFLVESEAADNSITGAFRRSAVVPPGEEASVFLPIPGSEDWIRIRAWLDGGTRMSETRHIGAGGRTNVAILGIQNPDVPPNERAWDDLLTMGSTPSADIRWRTVDEVPAAFQLLGGFDLILLQAPLRVLSDALQRALVQYVAAGGRLVVTNASPTPDGALALMESSLTARPESRPGRGLRAGRHGLGAWLSVASALPEEIAFDGWWDEQVTLGEFTARPSGGALPPFLWLALQIPGLGDVPVLAFFLLLLVFAVVAGPLSYAYFKRRRKIAWLLVTIPAMGFLFSAAILFYGFFSEGFGISGSVRSFTMLDQRTHEAVVAASRTLFAGLPVAAIEPSADTVLGVAERGRWDDPPVNLDANLDRGFRLDGSALPSRTPTTFVTTTVGRVRDRLRFKRQAYGAYDVLAGPNFVPVAEQGAVLLRTPEGGYFVSSPSGRLVPIGGQSPRRAIQGVLDPFMQAPVDRKNIDHDGAKILRRIQRHGAVQGPPPPGLPGLSAAWAAALVGESLPPGSYVARVQALPALDTLGLDVDVRAAEHVVFGILDEEDVLE